MAELSARTQQARELFAPLGPTYDRYAGLLSFGQDPRWRAFLVSRIPAGADARARRRERDGRGGDRAGARSTGAHRASASTRARRCSPPAAHASSSRARRTDRAARRASRERCRSPTRSSTRSPSRTCCATSTTPPRRCASSHASSARAARSPGSSSRCRAACGARSWELYVRVGLPLAGAAVVARLARGRDASSARASAASTSGWPLDAQLERGAPRGSATSAAGGSALGGGVVVWGRASVSRPAFYALRPGGWRDYVTLLHPPYTPGTSRTSHSAPRSRRR